MCLIDSFKKTDTEFLQKASAVSPSWKDGTTAVCTLLLDDTLYVANLGDSKAVAVPQGWGQAIPSQAIQGSLSSSRKLSVFVKSLVFL